MDKLVDTTSKTWNNIQMAYDLCELLKDKLPDSMEVVVRDDAAVWLEQPDGYIRILPKGANTYDLYLFVGRSGELVLTGRAIALPLNKVIPLAFNLAMAKDYADKHKILTKKERQSGKDNQDADMMPTADAEEVDEKNVYQYFANAGKELGKTDNLLKNLDLYSLKTLVKKPEVVPMPSAGLQLFTHQQMLKENVEKQINDKQGVVSLNENRDINKPYENTLGGQTLIVDSTGHVQFVNKKALNEIKQKEGTKLSWTPDEGCVLVPNSEETQKPISYCDPRR